MTDKLSLTVFDMAGTTVQATDLIPDAFRRAFAALDIDLADDEILSVRGRSKREAISALLTSHLGAAAAAKHTNGTYDSFQEFVLSSFETSGVEPVAGAAATFTWLQERGVKVALSTGFDRAVVELLLAKVGWRSLVDTVVCNADVSQGRPAPYLLFRAMEWTGCESVHHVAAVGDTAADLQAAHNAGVRWNIGVLSGAHRERQLREAPHSAIIPSVKELPALLIGLGVKEP